jgi:hypothetical protein
MVMESDTLICSGRIRCWIFDLRYDMGKGIVGDILLRIGD